MTAQRHSAKPVFDDLVDLHSRELFAYLWRMGGNTQDAEDLLQDTFLKAFRAYDRLPDGANVRAWLYKIATNAARTYYKKHNRQAAQTMPLEPYHADPNTAVSEEVERKLSLQAVAAATQALPDKQRTALVMHKFQHLSYVEIAEALDINEDAARANVYQAVKKLRDQFQFEPSQA